MACIEQAPFLVLPHRSPPGGRRTLRGAPHRSGRPRTPHPTGSGSRPARPTPALRGPRSPPACRPRLRPTRRCGRSERSPTPARRWPPRRNPRVPPRRPGLPRRRPGRPHAPARPGSRRQRGRNRGRIVLGVPSVAQQHVRHARRAFGRAVLLRETKGRRIGPEDARIGNACVTWNAMGSSRATCTRPALRALSIAWPSWVAPSSFPWTCRWIGPRSATDAFGRRGASTMTSKGPAPPEPVDPDRDAAEANG